MIKANYDKSLLSLTSSILKHFGVDVRHKTLPEADRLLAKNYKSVVLMLFDGMGKAILEKHLDENSFLRCRIVDTLSSVFPPTTTAATTTVKSGLSPLEHGWLGWTLHFDELNKNVSLFPNTLFRSDEKAADFHVAEKFLPYESVFDKIRRATNGEVEAYEVSKFSEFAVSSVDEICAHVQNLCAQDGRKYIYTYWKEPDYSMHEYGTEHGIVHENVREINAKVEQMCQVLKDTLVIVTADHGLIDTKWEFLPEYDDVMQCLADMPTVESRAMSFFVKQGMHEQFEKAFNEHFSKYYHLFTHEQAFEEKLFGDGIANKLTESFVGDYFAVAVSDVSLEVQARTADVFKAVHAGGTAQEYEVPLIVFEKA